MSDNAGYDPKKHFNPAVQYQINQEQIDELIEKTAKSAFDTFMANPDNLNKLRSVYEDIPVTNDPRAYTSDEVTKQFLESVAHRIHYWQTEPACGTMERRVAGVVHSIFSILDGATLPLPAFDLVPAPHGEDKQYHIDQGEKYYDPNTVVSVSLHHMLYPTLRELYPEPDAVSRANELTPDEMREKFVEAAELIGDEEAMRSTPYAAAHGAVRKMLKLLDGTYVSDIPAFMVTAAPTDIFNQQQIAESNKTWCEHIPVARREATFGFNESLTDTYDKFRDRSSRAGRDMFK